MGKNPWLDLHNDMQRQIGEASRPFTAKILSRESTGGYTVVTLDNQTYYNVKNQTRTKWQKDQWVAVQTIGGDLMITGLSSSRGGI